MTARVIKPAPVPVWDVPSGHFTAPCRAWWGQHWRPQTVWGKNDVAVSQNAVRGRQTQIEAGYTGSISGISGISKASAASVRLYQEHAKRKAGKGSRNA